LEHHGSERFTFNPGSITVSFGLPGILILLCLLTSLETHALPTNEKEEVRLSAFPFYAHARQRYIRETANNNEVSGDQLLDTLRTFDPHGDAAVAERITRRIGLSLVKQGKHAIALEVFNELRKHYESGAGKTEDDQRRYSDVLNVIGAIYEETGLWNEAMSLYMQSLQVCNTISYDIGKAKIYNNLGKLYFNRNQLAKAEELYNKAIEINKRHGIKPELFNNYNNLAGIYQVKHQPEKSLEYALIALNQLEIQKDFYDLSIIYDNIGNLYQDMGNFPVSLSYYQQAARIQDQKNYTDALIHSYLSMATLFRMMKIPDSAEFFLRKSLDMADALGNPSIKVRVLKDASIYYHRTGKKSLSADLFYRYFLLSDSLEALNSLARIEQIQSVYQIVNEEKNTQILK
jgi:tetratricopeptide (TPR) repeat protein